MEMAPEMRRVARRSAKNGVVPPKRSQLTERFDVADRQRLALAFRCPKDVVHPSDYFVEKTRE